jgi:hypothetical protein
MTPAGRTTAIVFVALGLRASINGPIDRPLCSLPSVRTVRPDLFFVGTALGDTVRAGQGEVVVRHNGGSSSRQNREIFGQVIRIDLLNSDAPGELEDALPVSRREVVLVPWGYDSICLPAYWNQSARFSEAGLEGLYSASLRPRRLWVGDRPTFDAYFAYFTPYPHAPAFRSEYSGIRGDRDHPALTAREHFSLNSALPTSSEVTRSPTTAYDRLRDWELQNPELAGRYPANEILAYMKPRQGFD